jgi:hypothetical protein
MMETLSIVKAGNLFWLGRYTQRVYTILHFFRKYRDMIIDVDADSYHAFCRKLGVEDKYNSASDFLRRYLFDAADGNSLIFALACAFDNGIVLRKEIKSETLSYVQLCVDEMERCAKADADVNALQPVTDSLMAFWGAVDERIFRRDVRNMIKAGWYLEDLDLHIRFEYPYERVRLLFDRLERHILPEKERAIFDLNLFEELKRELEKPAFNKTKALGMLARLFVLDAVGG